MGAEILSKWVAEQRQKSHPREQQKELGSLGD
jgi:hypothetical protein